MLLMLYLRWLADELKRQISNNYSKNPNKPKNIEKIIKLLTKVYLSIVVANPAFDAKTEKEAQTMSESLPRTNHNTPYK